MSYQQLYEILCGSKYNKYWTETEILAAGYEVVDVCEGCLINNLLCVSSDGEVRIFAEKPLNCWSSALELLPYRGNAAYDYWYENFATDEEV